MEYSKLDFFNYIEKVVELFEQKKEELSELDRLIGDGDHGVTMNIGWQAVSKALYNVNLDEMDISKISIQVGKVFLDAVGSSVGPLYASGFLKAAKAVKGKEALGEQELYDFWIHFVKGIHDRSQANIGEKTMMDTLLPFLKELETAKGENDSFINGYNRALKKAEEGMHSTKNLLSKKGRSSRLGERSVGTIDPGAASSYYLLNIFQ